ncbi:hypothetical protein I313_03084 [Cryptococcus deuterogattii Ram5]|uniref:Uncharacterized protein n=1 Tax=Cryptococcus deuterogattii Ram5 TaxID=1296110 RepID=A0A0D0T5F9_9TREE|nr:hypothetical protein I313_03084 [Cryptococcus deuterogattii Ram5]
MSAVISPSTVPLSVKSSTYSHRTLSPIPASQTAIMSGAYPSGDLIPNGTKIHVDARDGTNVALALDLDARRSPADLVVDDETPPVVNELKDAAAIPIDPALRFESEEEQDESMAEVVIGQKRKAEDELEEEEEREEIDEQEADTANQQENSVPKEETQDEPVREMTLGVEVIEGSEGGQPESETAAMEEADVVEKEDKPQTAKRAPRKRRKWLKKGEVDPDDPIAVARQQARHRLIDDAIACLDQQEKDLLDGSHPQLLWLWQELERRKEAQYLWAEAREQADEDQLLKMCDHWKRCARFNFHVRLEEIADQITHANRQKMARLTAERIALRRNPDALPNLRAGRGGGGWAIADKHLLSAGEQALEPIEVDGQVKQRRAIARGIQSLSQSDIQSDLLKMGLQRPPAPRSPSPPPRRPSPVYPMYNNGRSQSNKRPSQASAWQQPKEHYQQPPPPPLPPSSQAVPGMWDRPNSMYHPSMPLPPPQPTTYDARTARDYEAGMRRDRMNPPPTSSVPYASRAESTPRYHFWQPSSGPISKSNGAPSMSYFPSYPRTAPPTGPPPGIGLPPPRL